MNNNLKLKLKGILKNLYLYKPASIVYNKMLKNPRVFSYELDKLQDYFAFKQKINKISIGYNENNAQCKCLLIVSISNWIVQAKEEGLLAFFLQTKGFKPYILTFRDCKLAQKYHRAYGNKDFLYVDDLVSSKGSAVCELEIDNLFQEIQSINDIKNYTFHDVSVGKWALGAITRMHFLSKIDIKNNETIAILKGLIIDNMKEALAAEMLIDRLKPDLILFSEPIYKGYGPLYETAINKGINAIRWITGNDENLMLLQRCNNETRKYNPYSISPTTWTKIRNLVLDTDADKELMKTLKARYEPGKTLLARRLQDGKIWHEKHDMYEILGIDSTKKTAIIFCPLPWDASYFFGEDLFDDFQDWLVGTIKAAISNEEVNWIVKLHPGNIFKLNQAGWSGELVENKVIREEIWPLPSYIKVLAPETKISTAALFSVTDYCITVRGTIGIEMACYGIPVITAGTGRYDRRGFTIDSDSPAEYIRLLGNLHKVERLSDTQKELARKYAYALFKSRPLRLQSFKHTNMDLKKAEHPLYHNMEFCIQDYEELLHAKDLNEFLDWTVSSSESDYLVSSS